MLPSNEIIEKLKTKGVPRFRALQIMHAVFNEGKADYQEIKTIPANLRPILNQELPIFSIKLIKNQVSKDLKTEKYLFETGDQKKIEAVLMRFRDGRNSICVSSQVGCQLGCKFCATGTMKFGRNLTYEEIADQVLFIAQKLHQEGQKISNIVYMGMGEPFMNYDNVIQSAKMINDKQALNIGARKITISTSGICEGIEKLSNEDIQVNLAISLHAPNQELRAKIMPIANKYKLDQLMQTVKAYLDKTNRRVSYEYVMLNDINDHEEEAHQLAALVKDQLCHVNLIPYNATGIKGITGSSRSNISRFRDIINTAGIPVTVRVTIGQDIDAACGQLANKTQPS